jgi:hypothetical protein
MLEIMKKLRQEYGAVSVKAEFEAEGTRTEELLRLVDLARRADLKVGLKIGGCEAMRDIIESKHFGVEYIIAPMVETPYALKKFIDAKNKYYTAEQKKDTSFLCNLETITAYDNLDGMMKVATIPEGVQGIVFGRVDFVGSRGQGRAAIVSAETTDYVMKTGAKCKENNLELVVGGGVGIDSIPELKKMKSVHLTRFETRKIIFGAAALDNPKMAEGLKNTVYFELEWLKNKRDYYGEIQGEDAARIEMLDKRWDQLKQAS